MAVQKGDGHYSGKGKYYKAIILHKVSLQRFKKTPFLVVIFNLIQMIRSSGDAIGVLKPHEALSKLKKLL